MRTSMCISLLDLPSLDLNKNLSPGYWCLSNTMQQICESRSIKISIALSQCCPVFPAYQRWWQDLIWLLGSLCVTAIKSIYISLATVPCMKDALNISLLLWHLWLFNLILFSLENFLWFLKYDCQANIPILSFSTAFRHLERKCDLKEMWCPIKIDDSGLLSSRDYLTVSRSFLSIWNWAVGCVLLFLLSPGGICTYQQKLFEAVETKGMSCIVTGGVVMCSF